MKLFLALIVWMFSTVSLANDKAIGQLFEKNKAKGTLVIQSLNRGTTYTWDQDRSIKKLASASTFKIFNTLIAIDEGVFDPSNDVFKWDGTQYEFTDWNQNLTLANAYKVSCVWCYQKLAERIGSEKYLNHLRKAKYGEISVPFDGTTFWLDGSFRVSAMDQIQFLKQIYSRSLPYKPTSYDQLKSIMKADSPAEYQLYAKTGWARRVNPEIGWYVGYVETKNDVWFFALNMNIDAANQLPLRQKLVLDALEAKGIIKSNKPS